MSETENFLVEIGSEELPPTSLNTLIQAFADAISQGLSQANLSYQQLNYYATPRRLAVLVHHLTVQQPDSTLTRNGPSVSAAFDKHGKPTPACQGFAKSLGVNIDALQRQQTAKGERLYYQQIQPGQATTALLPAIIDNAIKQMPIAKPMRWGNHAVEFVRPVHWLVALFGNHVIPCTILGKTASNLTYGHRFHHPQPLTIDNPVDYETILEQNGFVIASVEKRQAMIRAQVTDYAQQLGGSVSFDKALLEEVTNIVEWPQALAGKFHQDFLQVPHEALITSMKIHQKYFHVVDKNNKLLPYFITVSNIHSKQPQAVINGNEKVISARLSDAQFFYQTDLKQPLADFCQQLKNVIFQKKLGNLAEKAERIAILSAFVAKQIGGNATIAKRAGQLCKADLMSAMVGEFPELQGIMGSYYAQHANEAPEIVTAIQEHYQPRFADDQLPSQTTSYCVAIADRIDSLVGIFGIGQLPSGEKDPFALRRAALSILKIIIDCHLSVDLRPLIERAAALYNDRLTNMTVIDDVLNYTLERLRRYYLEKNISPHVFAAVFANRPSQPVDFHSRIMAVNDFYQMPAASALAAANKRVSKILLKEGKQDINRQINQTLLAIEAEKQLAELIIIKNKQLRPLFEKAAYAEALTHLASLREPVDRFFDEVMVMVEDENIRNNRLALLANLRDLFLHVADISLLQ